MGQCENKFTTGVSVNEPRKSAWLYRKLSTSCAIGTTMFFQAYRTGMTHQGSVLAHSMWHLEPALRPTPEATPMRQL